MSGIHDEFADHVLAKKIFCLFLDFWWLMGKNEIRRMENVERRIETAQ